MCDLDDGGYCDVWRESKRTACKAHKCSCCGRAIKPGEQYVDHFDIFEEHINRAKLCADCQTDREEFAKEHEGTMVHPDAIEESLWDCIEQDHEYDDDDELKSTELTARWEAILERINQRRELAKTGSGGEGERMP